MNRVNRPFTLESLRLLRSGSGSIETIDGADAEDLRDAKEQVLASIHRLLCIHLGTPPESFVWQWKDTDGGFHRDLHGCGPDDGRAEPPPAEE